MRVHRLGDMRVRRFGDNGRVLRGLIVELKAVAISVLSPVAVAQPALDGHAVEVGAMPRAPVAEVAEVWAPGPNVGRKYAATLKRLGNPGSRLYRCPSVCQIWELWTTHSA
jgi:hypothetical protein